MINTVKKFIKSLINFWYFYKDYLNFKKNIDERFDVKITNWHVCLGEKNIKQSFDAHYLYHPAWAARIIAKTNPAKHVDIASILSFATLVSAFVPVEYYDYRPANLKLSNLSSRHCDLVQLDFADNSINSLSCMHTIEHIGLGRYGDRIDPQGDLKAMAELKRVVRPGGDLLFVTPVGQPKLKFNANRVYSFEFINQIFSDFELVDFSLVLDDGSFVQNADPVLVAKQLDGCGCFWFKKLK
jgi:SAM-dependent methyltransferase